MKHILKIIFLLSCYLIGFFGLYGAFTALENHNNGLAFCIGFLSYLLMLYSLYRDTILNKHGKNYG